MARGHHHSGAMHEGKHHVSHHGSQHVEHHHYKRGGHMERKDGGAMHGEKDFPEKDPELDYTAKSNVVPEAEGKKRKHGGAVHHGKHHVSHHGTEHAEHHHHADGGAIALARGGRAKKEVEGHGHKGHHRLDRPGRKRGGGVGSDMTPLTTAARVREAGMHKADNDELEE